MTLRSNLQGLKEELEQAGGVRERWESEPHRLVGLISRSFGENMEEIGCAGEAGVSISRIGVSRFPSFFLPSSSPLPS